MLQFDENGKLVKLDKKHIEATLIDSREKAEYRLTHLKEDPKALYHI